MVLANDQNSLLSWKYKADDNRIRKPKIAEGTMKVFSNWKIRAPPQSECWQQNPKISSFMNKGEELWKEKISEKSTRKPVEEQSS